jgi:hypothetical protein
MRCMRDRFSLKIYDTDQSNSSMMDRAVKLVSLSTARACISSLIVSFLLSLILSLKNIQ